MTDQQVVADTDDTFELIIMEIIQDLGDEAYGMNIQKKVGEGFDEQADLVCIYEVLIDLLLDNRITFKLSVPEDTRSRKIYSLATPE